MPRSGELERFIDALGSFQAGPALELARQTAHRDGVDVTITRLLAAAQHEAGRRWEFGEWTVSQEHAATAIVDDALGSLRAMTPVRDRGPRLALVCAEGEWHVTPARMAALRFEQRGWRTTFLGASTPGPHLARTLRDLPVDVVGVSCTMPNHLPGARRTVEIAHDQGFLVVAGGAALGPDGRRARAIGADAGGGDLDSLAATARSWLDRPVTPATPQAHHQQEVDLLRRSRAWIVGSAYADLLADLPELTETPDDRLTYTTEELNDIVEFLEAALDVGDPSVFHDFLRWLSGVLAIRGVSLRWLTAGLQAIERHLDDNLPEARALLDAGIDQHGN